MAERVSDELLQQLAEDYETVLQEALDMLDPEEEDNVRAAVMAFRELQQRRAQRCETCDSYTSTLDSGRVGDCVAAQNGEGEPLMVSNIDYCSWWRAIP